MSSVPKGPEVPENLKSRGYDWIPESPKNIARDFENILNKNNARCFIIDVHEVSGTFRNAICILEEYPGHESELNIGYNKITGKHFTILKRK